MFLSEDEWRKRTQNWQSTRLLKFHSSRSEEMDKDWREHSRLRQLARELSRKNHNVEMLADLSFIAW
jgi:hypothetical protein